jgi:hypothetical protein
VVGGEDTVRVRWGTQGAWAEEVEVSPDFLLSDRDAANRNQGISGKCSKRIGASLSSVCVVPLRGLLGTWMGHGDLDGAWGLG